MMAGVEAMESDGDDSCASCRLRHAPSKALATHHQHQHQHSASPASCVATAGKLLLYSLMAKRSSAGGTREAGGTMPAGPPSEPRTHFQLWHHMLHECDPASCSLRYCCCARSILTHLLECKVTMERGLGRLRGGE